MKPRQLVDRVERLGHLGLARDAEEGRVAGDRVDQLLRVALLLEQLQRLARVAGLEVGVALVVEVVEDPGGGPQLLVLAALARVGAHRGLDAQHVLAQRVGLGPLAEQLPGLVAGRAARAAGYPARERTCGEMAFATLAQPLEPRSRRLRAWRSSSSKAAQPLSGTVVPAGNKNAALPVLAATLLTEEEVVLRNIPRIRDVEAMLELLRAPRRQRRVARRQRRRGLRGATSTSTEVDAALPSASARRSCSPARCWRASASADMPPPGGDVIGRRRLDPHLDAFRALGADGALQPRRYELSAPAACGPATSSWTSRR